MSALSLVPTRTRVKVLSPPANPEVWKRCNPSLWSRRQPLTHGVGRWLAEDMFLEVGGSSKAWCTLPLDQLQKDAGK